MSGTTILKAINEESYFPRWRAACAPFMTWQPSWGTHDEGPPLGIVGMSSLFAGLSVRVRKLPGTGDWCPAVTHVCMHSEEPNGSGITTFFWTSIPLSVKTRLPTASEKLQHEAAFFRLFSTSPWTSWKNCGSSFISSKQKLPNIQHQGHRNISKCLELHVLHLSKAGIPKHWYISENCLPQIDQMSILTLPSFLTLKPENAYYLQGPRQHFENHWHSDPEMCFSICPPRL